MVKRKSKKRKEGKSGKESSHVHPLSGIKISEAILILSDSLRKKYRSIPQTKAIVSVTVMAWNLSLFPDEERENVKQILIESLPDEFSGEDTEVLLTSIDNLIAQKKKLYPHIREYILNYDLSLKGSEMTLNVETASIKGEIKRK
jgi:hypothetical protein